MEESQGQFGFLQVVPEISVATPHDTESRNASIPKQFFINFLTWSTIYTIYVFVVLVCKLSQGGSADGQMIGIAAL